MESVYEEIYKGYRVEILPDDSDQNPREWDNVGTMVTWHNRYSLGDVQPRQDFENWLIDFTVENCVLSNSVWDKYNDDALTIDDCWRLLDKQFIFLPLYLYDHSGISISTHSFVGRAQHAEWDSGQVGWIYVSKERAVEEWGKKLYTKKVEEKAIRYLRGEVETYDDYLTGNVYGYKVSEIDEQNPDDKDSDELLESCWGYFPEHDGKYPDYKGCLDEAKGIVDYLAKERDTKKNENGQLVAMSKEYTD